MKTASMWHRQTTRSRGTPHRRRTEAPRLTWGLAFGYHRLSEPDCDVQPRRLAGNRIWFPKRDFSLPWAVHWLEGFLPGQQCLVCACRRRSGEQRGGDGRSTAPGVGRPTLALVDRTRECSGNTPGGPGQAGPQVTVISREKHGCARGSVCWSAEDLGRAGPESGWREVIHVWRWAPACQKSVQR